MQSPEFCRILWHLAGTSKHSVPRSMTQPAPSLCSMPRCALITPATPSMPSSLAPITHRTSIVNPTLQTSSQCLFKIPITTPKLSITHRSFSHCCKYVPQFRCGPWNSASPAKFPPLYGAFNSPGAGLLPLLPAPATTPIMFAIPRGRGPGLTVVLA